VCPESYVHGEPHEHFPRQNREGFFAAAFFFVAAFFLGAALRAAVVFPFGAFFFADFAFAM